MVSVKPLIVHWHQDSAPIYGACFQPKETLTPQNRSARLITAGGDNNVRVWRLKFGADPAEAPYVEYYSTLGKHERAVNCVEFDPSGQVLASAGDDGTVCLWTLNEATQQQSLQPQQPQQQFGADFEDLESWRLVRKCRTASFGEIYDLAWSPCGRYLAATSMDKVVSVLDTLDGTSIAALRDHKHYVQGVSWDPRGEFLATQSSDQRVLIYALKTDAKTRKLNVSSAPTTRLDRTELDATRVSSFHPESFSSFFRRLSFSPDGSLLVVPACQISPKKQQELETQINTEKAHEVPNTEKVYEAPKEPEALMNTEKEAPEALMNTKQDVQKDATDVQKAQNDTPEPRNEEPRTSQEDSQQETKQEAKQETEKSASVVQSTVNSEQDNVKNCALVFTRGNLQKPAAVLPLPKPSTAVQFCPLLFKLRHTNQKAAVSLPYRMVYAVATLNGVFLYDTEQTQPLGTASNLHYSAITDLSWSPDGRLLLLTSIDGFCSVFRFDRNELGEIYRPPTTTTTSDQPAAPSEEPQGVAPALQNQQTTINVINTLSVRKKPKQAPPQTAAGPPVSNSN